MVCAGKPVSEFIDGVQTSLSILMGKVVIASQINVLEDLTVAHALAGFVAALSVERSSADNLAVLTGEMLDYLNGSPYSSGDFDQLVKALDRYSLIREGPREETI